MRLNQKQLQTNSPRGTFSTGDKHPTEPRVVYCRWQKLTWGEGEVWLTVEQLKSRQELQDERRSRFNENNPGYNLEKNAMKRAKKSDAIVKLTADEHAMVLGFYEKMERLNKIFGPATFDVDHTVPIALGGKHHPSNLQVVPSKWNMTKSNRHGNRWEVPFGGKA